MVALLYIPLSVQTVELLNATLFPRRTPLEETRFSDGRKKLLGEVPDAILFWDIFAVFQNFIDCHCVLLKVRVDITWSLGKVERSILECVDNLRFPNHIARIYQILAHQTVLRGICCLPPS